MAFEQTHSSGVSREDFSHLLRKKTFPSVYREEKQKRAPDGFWFLSSTANRPNSPPGHGIRFKARERLAVRAVFVFQGTDEGDDLCSSLCFVPNFPGAEVDKECAFLSLVSWTRDEGMWYL